MIRPLLLLVLPLSGCADYEMSNAPGARDDTAGSPDSHDSGYETDTDTGPPLVPAWWIVRAQLSVVGGAPSLLDASVEIDVVDADLERIACTVALNTAGLAVGTLDDADVAFSWELAVDSTVEPCAPLPDTLGLGIGTLLPDVRARLGSVGYDDIADSLYGAYVRAEGTPLAVYGYAGTAGDLGGDDAASFPPPDGAYALAPLYVLELPAR